VTARRWSSVLVFVPAAALTSVFFINLCGTIFCCGCASLWSGADADCNIHRAGSRHCPWCMHGQVNSAIPWLLIVVAQAAISFWPRPMPAAMRFVLVFTAFPVAGAVLALAYGLSVDYWK